MKYTITAHVWAHDGPAPWHFATIVKSDAEKIKAGYVGMRRGFGSIPVNVQIRKTAWRTSIFPDKDGSYLLPLKKAVRASENVKSGDDVKIQIEIAE